MTEDMQDLQLDELTILKARADDMGVEYHPSIGVGKLKEKIAEKLDKSLANTVPTNAQSEKSALRQAKVKEATKLVRLRVTCMNPHKREWAGEIITVANKSVGTLRKYVPYDVEWHVPYFIHKVLADRKFRMTKQVPDGKGGKIAQNKFVPEFNIEVLPPLSKEELEALASDQAKRGAIDKD